MEKKGPYTVEELRNLDIGVQFWGKYLVLEVNRRKIKDGREIINLRLGDSTGEVDAIVWDSCKVIGQLQVGEVIGVLADIGFYNNRLQATAKRIKILEEETFPYLKKPDVDINIMIKRFARILESITDSYLQNLLQQIFTPETKNDFFRAPAAKKIHHNYCGGLLEHTLTVVELCLRVAKVYPLLNKDLLITGALLHDIGKLNEFKMKVVPEYTDEGRLIGHIVMGSELITAKINEIRANGGAFPDKLEWMLKHMILSHHGNLEFGSPIIPLFPEAFVLYMMDNLDAKIFVFKEKIDENSNSNDFFTNYDTLFGQNFYTYRYKGNSEGQ